MGFVQPIDIIHKSLRWLQVLPYGFGMDVGYCGIFLRRGLLACFFCLAIGFSGISSSSPELPGSQDDPLRAPNIVLLIADDLGWADVGYHGSEIATPTIDTLAAEGLQLDRFYTYPACTPTRASLISGQRMRTVGLIEPIPPWSDAGLPLDIATLPEELRKVGYATWKIGKWHLGDHYPEQFPNQRGFDHFYGFLSGEINYYTHLFVSALDWQRNGVTLQEEGYATHLLTDEAVRLLESHSSNRPFFLDLSYNAPHTPLQAPEETVAEYAGIENFNRRRYAAMVTEMDRGIARVIEAIRKRPDARNTMVMFMSDNGGMPPFGASNAPLKGIKSSHYEGGIRVPAVIWWPAVVPAGVHGQIVSVHDLFPTLLALAGAPPSPTPARPGIDFWPSVVAEVLLQRDEPISFAMMLPGPPGTPATQSGSVIVEGWKLIEVGKFLHDAPPSERYQLEKRELYNILADPLEQQELSAGHPEKTQELLAVLNDIPAGKPIGFRPPPKDWKFSIAPGVEPDNGPARRTAIVEAALARAQSNEQ